MIAWVFFRSENISGAIDYLLRMIIEIRLPSDNRGGSIFVLVILFLDWSMRRNERDVLNFNILYSIFENKWYATMFSFLIYYIILTIIIYFYFFKNYHFTFVYFSILKVKANKCKSL